MRAMSFFVIPIAVVAGIVAVACGAGCAAKGTGASYDPGVSDDTNAGDPPKSTSDAGSSDVQAPPAQDAGATTPPADAGAPDVVVKGGGDSGGGDPTSIASLFPAAVGHSWTFQVTSDFDQCRGTRTGQVLGQQKVDGRDAVWISSYCDGVAPAAVSISAQSADVDVQGQYIPQLAEPVAEGAKFTSISGNTTWHKEGTVTVPAGTFTGCWRAATGSTFVIYCPGAGTVHIHEQYSNGVIDAVLTAKNF